MHVVHEGNQEKRNIPGVLWVAIIALAGISVIQLGVAIARPNPGLLLGVALQAAIVYGLYSGHRWAYVTLLVTGVLSIIVVSLRDARVGLATLVIDSIVLVPMLVSTRYFFGPWAPPERHEPLRCPTCGYSLLGLTEPRCPECGREFDAPVG